MLTISAPYGTRMLSSKNGVRRGVTAVEYFQGADASTGVSTPSADVQALQNALKSLAISKGTPDPGTADGMVKPSTLNALTAAVLRLPIPGLPSNLKPVLSVVGAIGWDYARSQPVGSTLYTAYDAAMRFTIANAGKIALAIQLYAGSGGGGGGGGGAPEAARYAAGTIARYHRSKRVYSIYSPTTYVPITRAAIPFTFHGATLGVATDTVPPPNTVKVAEEPTVPAGATQGEDEDYPWYKNWKVWALIGGAVVVVGGGGYFFFKD
jgi:hypothetical protein